MSSVRVSYPLIIRYTLITYNFPVFTNGMISQAGRAFRSIYRARVSHSRALQGFSNARVKTSSRDTRTPIILARVTFRAALRRETRLSGFQSNDGCVSALRTCVCVCVCVCREHARAAE